MHRRIGPQRHRIGRQFDRNGDRIAVIAARRHDPKLHRPLELVEPARDRHKLRVELKSLQTGQSFTTNTRSNGRYSFENVTPGSGYQLTIRAIGFLPQVQQGLVLGLGIATYLIYRLAAALQVQK
jgi:hypothetical protein